MKKVIVFLIVIVVLAVNPVAMALILDDGLSHTISRYYSGNLDIDPDNDIIPGTQVNLINGGQFQGSIDVYHHATLNVNGGTVNSGGFHAYGDSIVTVTNGLVKGYSSAVSNSTVNVQGGDINNLQINGNATLSMSGGSLGAFSNYGNSIVSIFGGSIEDYLRVGDNGIIYLYGTDFEVNGQTLFYGDHLSDFVPLTYLGETHYQKTGIITGTLADGTALNNTFQIMYWDGIIVPADIMIVPEPTMLLLIGLGGIIIRKRKVSN